MADVFRDPKRQAIDHPALRSLFDYWSGRRNGACLPARRAIDPLDTPELLPHLKLTDVEPTAELRFRPVGTALDRHLGRDTTGLAVWEGYFATDWEKIQEAYRYVIAKRRPCLRHNQGVGRDRRTFDYQRLLLPLAADGAEVDMILAAAFWLEDAWSRA
jgi:hypothetical protein